MSSHNNYIGGRWVSSTGETANINPSNIGDTIGHFPQGTVEDVAAAVAAANEAAEAWAYATPLIRSDLLEAVAQKLFLRQAEIGRLLAREEGKTLAEGVGETVRAAQIFRFFAGEALRAGGDYLPSIRPDVDVEVSREPVGVVGLITPWNFPIAIPAWKIAPALAFGNTVVLKPAELTPACAHVLAELLDEAGCPAGVFNLVTGAGQSVGRALVAHQDVNAISFTGSQGVGQALLERCAASAKKVQLEMGGKNPTLVMDDADLDVAVAVVVNAAFFSTGQRCTATSRVIVHQRIHDEFVERLVAATSALVVGDALDPATQIGPVVSERQLLANLDYVALAHAEGAQVVGGERLDRASPGFYQAPALFLGARNDMRIAREEIFGPCLSVIEVADFDEGLAMANDTPFGLSSGICTRSLLHARTFKRRSKAGMVMVNLPTAGVDFHVPFGGRKGSSYGAREQGVYAREFYTSLKTAYSLAV
ncbi:aldehyde dehydrogenase family protein [Sphingobium aquiterrae]|uniref:aldehyde dehydrogenase family protein n=1 Tax=Sphingobium aquiterrae TaxID=2038656 RepID=UPI003018675A